jgi:hypothetical protein
MSQAPSNLHYGLRIAFLQGFFFLVWFGLVLEVVRVYAQCFPLKPCPQSFLLLAYYLNRASNFCPQLALDYDRDPPTSAS